MCTYLTMTEPITGSGSAGDGWLDLATAVVFYDHPQEVPVEHALCIDFRNRLAGPADRLAVELTADAARQLATTILSVLDSPEARCPRSEALDRPPVFLAAAGAGGQRADAGAASLRASLALASARRVAAEAVHAVLRSALVRPAAGLALREQRDADPGRAPVRLRASS